MRAPIRLSEWIATGFGAGFLPVAPGTWGSFEAAVLTGLIAYGVPAWSGRLLWVLFLVSLVSGVFCAGKLAARIGDSDPSRVVIDEIAGQFLTYLWVPMTIFSLGAGFLLFRIFDIIKPFPARRSEQLPGGWGIVADDLIAGLYSGVVLLLLEYAGIETWSMELLTWGRGE